MAHIVLVHGMTATGKSWFDIPDLLRAKGHDVSVVDLPGHVQTGIFSILTSQFVKMEDYVDEVAKYLSPSRPSVLVGHSMGGAVISHVAAQFPDRVSDLVYFTAMVPKDGETIGKIVMRTGTDMSDIKEEFEAAGIEDGDPALGNQPMPPFFKRFETNTKFEALKKHYVRCSKDKIIKPPLQEAFCKDWDITSSITLESGHLAMKTMPSQLADGSDGLTG